ncbi:MAG: DNA replication and repair protein RecF [bacterium]|jgi:DNA replication and repair protein RecF
MLSCPVLIERIRLRDYRNLAKVDITPAKGVNLVFGANAQGKTNFLDALHLATYLKSARAAREREVVREGAEIARCEVHLTRADGGLHRLVVAVSRGKKFVKLDGNPVTRFEDAIGILSAHFFFPGDLSLVKGDPALRRETLDLEVLKAVPSSVRIYSDYRRALLHRNALLRRIQSGDAKASAELAPWNERLIASGVEIVRMRRNLLARIVPHFLDHYSKISDNPEPVGLHYIATISDGKSDARDRLRKDFAEKLADGRAKETELGYTVAGPHRDELLFSLGRHTLRQFGSQGQQRSAVLALKIALCDVARELSGEDPVLCLDDALSELDDARKAHLLAALKHRTQAFITLASEKELGLVRGMAAAVWTVKNGNFDGGGK